MANELRQLQEKMQLNDWGYFKLLEQAARSMEISHNQQILFSWVVLLKSGHNATVGFNDNKVYLMLPTKEEIFPSYYLTVDGSPYYIQTKHDKNNPLPSLTIHKANYPVSRINFEEWMAGNKTAINDFQNYLIHIEILGD